MTGNRDAHASHRPRSVVSSIYCAVAGYGFPQRMQRTQRMRWAIRSAAPIRDDEANPTFLTERSHGHNDPASCSDRVIVGWVQPTSPRPPARGCTHPTNGSPAPGRRIKELHEPVVVRQKRNANPDPFDPTDRTVADSARLTHISHAQGPLPAFRAMPRRVRVPR